MRLLHKGESLCCFRDSASVTYGGMLPSDLTLSALRFILSAKSRKMELVISNKKGSDAPIESTVSTRASLYVDMLI